MVDVAYLRQLESNAVAVIRLAFPSGAPPAFAQMHNDHCPECSETSARFRGKRWEEITVAELVGNPPVALLTAAAFSHYLPALMLRCIEAPEKLDCLPDHVIGCLSPPNGKPSAKLAELLRGYDAVQITAVRAFLHVLEAREKLQAYPAEAFDTAPTSKKLTRAIVYWSAGGAPGGACR